MCEEALKVIQKLITIFDKATTDDVIQQATKLITDDIMKHVINSQHLFGLHTVHSYKTNNLQCDSSKCAELSALGTILKNYRKFIEQNEQDSTFIVDIVSALNHFHHLLFEHQNDFEHIYNELIDKYNDKKDCLLANCLLIRRNQCQSSEQWNNLYYNTNVKHITIQQIMDTIHCHFFHSFDIGYQFTQKEKNNIPQKTDEKEEKDNDTSDKIVKYIHGKMQQKRKLCQGIKGLERITDSQKFRSDYKCGIKYFYWDYYKDKEVLNDPAVIHDRSKGRDYLIRHVNEGHKNKKKYMLKDWYIQSMFQNLKQELLKNKICTISPIQWNSLLEKATKHIQTNFAKTLKCAGPHRKEIYGIVLGQPITAEHIIAMMVYCNYDTLQKRFSTTFRRVDEHMEDNEIKQAHQNYAHLGRLLREFTDCFGTSV
eukprot:229601_1